MFEHIRYIKFNLQIYNWLLREEDISSNQT